MNYKRVFIQNSCVHVVIVSYKRHPIFIENINLLKKSILHSKKYFDYNIISICVLPEHIHMIISPKEIEEYPKIITSIKYYFSRNYNVGLESPTYGYVNKKEKGIFQRRYFEHTIVGQEDLERQINYIHYNPVKHGYAKFVKDWSYSSFLKFVEQNFYDEDWGSAKDVKDIVRLNYE